MTKTEIKEKFDILKKWGYITHNFQSRRYNPKGSKGFSDLHIICPGDFVLYIDIKTKHDKPSPAQLKFRSDVNTMLTRAVHLWATEENHERLINAIMSKQYLKLKNYE